VTPSARTRPGPVGCLVGLGGLAFAAVMTTVIITIGIWPGEAKLVAPLLCPDDQPDAFVVSDTYQVQPGETTTNFTLYCMGEQGQHTEIGFFLPFAILTVVHGGIWLVLFLVLGARGAARLRRAGTPAAPGAPPPPAPPEVVQPAAVPPPPPYEPPDSDLPPPGPIIS
jgi:hypothetical protein